MTESLEMYLETIGFLHDRIRIARVTDIAQELGVSKSSVHSALHELEKRGYIDHEHYGEVFLTETGRTASASIKKRHALLTDFFRDILGVSVGTAEEDACRIEHYLSEEALLRIEEAVRGGKRFGSGMEAEADGVSPLPATGFGADAPREPRVNWIPVVPEWKPGSGN